MKKLLIGLFILNPFIAYIGFGQQIQSNIGNEIGSLQNMETFLNRKLINPTNLTDSNNFIIDFAIHEQLISNKKATNGFFLSGETGLESNKCSFGITIDFNNNGLLQNRSILSSFKYNLINNTDSRFELGLNLGLGQTRIDESSLMYSQDPLSESDYTSDWQTNAIIDLGVNYNYKTHNFRISYNNFLNESTTSTTFRGLILNYQSTFAVTRKVTLTPDIFGCLNSENTYGILSLKLNYNKRISCGLLYNTKNSSGFLISGIIKKKVKIGYYYNMLNINHQTFSSHCINLGLIIK